MAHITVNDDTPRIQYTATASQTVFTVPWPFFTEASLKVYQTLSGAAASDATDILTLNTDYTVQGEGNVAGTTKTITLTTGAASGDILTILRDEPIARTTDYQTAGDFLAATINDEQDLEIMIAQQLEESGTRKIGVQITDTSTLSSLPSVSDRKGKILQFDSSGDVQVVTPGTLISAVPTDTLVLNSIATLQASTVTSPTYAYLTGYYTAGDQGGGWWWFDSSDTSTADDAVLNVVDAQTVRAGTWKRIHNGTLSVREAGAKGDAATDDTAAIQAAIDSGVGTIYFPAGEYRCDSAINPVGGQTWIGVKEATYLFQYGPYLIQQTTEDMDGWVMDGFTLDFKSTSTSRYDCAFSLLAHRDCIIRNIRTVRYDDQTIMERLPSSAAGVNTIDNLYQDWYVSACACLDVAIGLDGYYYMHQGDAATTVLATSIVWPENPGLASSVVVIQENANRIFSELTGGGTDYTAAYDGSNNLTVTMTTAPAANVRIHIWPAQPNTGGNRRPLSNNVWERVKVQYCFLRGWQCARWVDAESYINVRILLAANNTRGWIFNPYNERAGQAGDFMNFVDGVISYQGVAFVATPSTLIGIDMGPGSDNIQLNGTVFDLLWRHSGNNKAIDIDDNLDVSIATGTVTTNGTTTVTGNSTTFETHFTLVGDVPDAITIEGVDYGIASIDSDTQITTTATVPTAATVAYGRHNYENGCSYMADIAAGDGNYSPNSKKLGRYGYRLNSSVSGQATVLDGNSNVVVSYALADSPGVGDIYVTAHSDIGTRIVRLSNITHNTANNTGTFQLNLSSAASGADLNFGYRIELGTLN